MGGWLNDNRRREIYVPGVYSSVLGKVTLSKIKLLRKIY